MLYRLKEKPDRLTVNLPEGKRDMYTSAAHEFIAETDNATVNEVNETAASN